MATNGGLPGYIDVAKRFGGEGREITLILYVLAGLHDGLNPWGSYKEMETAGVAPPRAEFFALWSACAEALGIAGRIFGAEQ